MSHQRYHEVWGMCMQDLAEQVQIEYLPVQAHEQGHPFEVGFQHYALLQIKYMQIYKNLEDCYDQMIHPQKRRFIKIVLENVIVRILELRQQLIYFNPRPKQRIVALDEVLTDLKLNPDTVEWRVPRFFLDDKERKDEIEVKQKKLDHWLRTFNMSLAPDDLCDKRDPFQVDLTIEQAIRLIQKNERGRIGIQRAMMVSDWRKDALKKEERQKKLLNEQGANHDYSHEKQFLAATRIAAHWKRKVDKKYVARMRELTFQFVGMGFRPKPQVDQIALADENRDRRKQTQLEVDDIYERALLDELDDLKAKKGPDIKMDLFEERRQWILDYRKNNAKFPDDFQAFYIRHEEDEEDGDEEEAGDKKTDKKTDKKADKKDDKKGDKKDKKKEKAEEKVEEHQVGTSSLVPEFVNIINEFGRVWENKDESKNFEQRHDLELCREKVLPLVEARVKQTVDDQMTEELANLKQMYDKKKKDKKKGKKKGKKGGGKKDKKAKAKKWCAAVGMISNREDCFPDLAEQGIVKKIKPEYLKNIYGGFHYLGAMQRVNQEYVPPPSVQMTKSLIVEHCMMTLASHSIRQKAPYAARSLLLYGPKGNAKSALARAIATEVGATFFDLSPSVIEGKYTQAKTGAALLIYKVFLVAQDHAPAVIYLENIDQVFQTVRGKKKGGDGEAPSRIKKDLIAAIKQVKTGAESVDQDRILFIGTTNRPFADGVDTKELLAAFDEKIWINSPDYGSRVLLWEKFLQRRGVQIDPARLNLSSLSQISEGYSSGSIMQTVDRVLTNRRLQQLKYRPLTMAEFLGPLSRTNYCHPEEWKEFRAFDHVATGEKERFEKLLKAAEGKDEEGGKAKK